MEEKKLVDPLNGQVYTARADGRVDVVDPATGQSGIFDHLGQWHSGDLTYANRQLLGWIGRLAVRRAADAGP
ncbi:MAG: transposase [Sporichthyaceae bacterium]